LQFDGLTAEERAKTSQVKRAATTQLDPNAIKRFSTFLLVQSEKRTFQSEFTTDILAQRDKYCTRKTVLQLFSETSGRFQEIA